MGKETKFKVGEKATLVVSKQTVVIKEITFCGGSPFYMLMDEEGVPWSTEPAMDEDLAKIEEEVPNG